MNLLFRKFRVQRKYLLFGGFCFLFFCALAPVSADEILLREIQERASHVVKTQEDSIAIIKATFYQTLGDETYLDQLDKAVSDLPSAVLQKGNLPIYLAASKLVHAQNTLWPIRKVNLVHEALDEMDALLKAAPNDFEVRMVHAASFHDVPEVFGRKEKAREELTGLFKNFEEDSRPYPNFLRVEWLGYFIENGLASDASKYKALYVSWGGTLSDIE